MTTPEKQPNHMTFNAAVSFDLKMVLGMEAFRPALAQLEQAMNDPEQVDKMDTKLRIFAGLILEGKTEEERAARFLQYRLREGLNEALREELVEGNDENLRLSVSPVKFRFHVNDTKAA